MAVKRTSKKTGKKAAKASKTKTAKRKSTGAKKATAKRKTKAAPKPRPAARKKTAAAAPASKRAAAKKKPRKRATKARPAKRERLLDLESFRQQLRAKQAELLQAFISATGDSRSRQSDGTEDYIDYAVSSYDREFLLSLSELDQHQLLLVDEALRRLDAGEFGRCSQCEKPIPSKRLEVQPWARYCVACQELADQGLTDSSSEDMPDDEDDFDLDEDDEDEDDAADDIETAAS